MSKRFFTDNQIKAIVTKNTNILVAAAAGAGKTTVLVERIINKIIKEKIDIDKILIVTFTNAAASEMKEKISEEIYKKLEENPTDSHLQKQIILLNKANISTIHAFCLEVIRNNFFEINLSSNIRVIDENEIEILKQEVLEEIFEDLYETKNKEFLELVDIYANYRDDELLKEIILKIYNYIQSTDEPIEWLDKKTEYFNNIDKDFAKTIWGKIIINNLKEEVIEYINIINSIILKIKKEQIEDKIIDILNNDINTLEKFLQKDYSWDEICNILNEIFDKKLFLKWQTSQKLTGEEKEILEKEKVKRDKIKEKLKDSKNKIFIYDSKQAKQDIELMHENLKKIKEIIIKFSNRYQKIKKDKEVIDYNDIEHYALQILSKKDENGNYEKTDIAKQYENKFIEIAIDEYQDSNMVQERILNLISNGKNIFMIGDVKQSIYKFRHARPEIFKEKYNKYIDINKTKIELKENNVDENGTKIKLFENFRSRKNIIDFTNLVFESIMSNKIGDIDYNKEEYLNFGATYPKTEYKINEKGYVEIDILDLCKDEIDEIENENEYDYEPDQNEIEYSYDEEYKYKQDDEEEFNKKNIEKIEISAKHVAKKIQDIINSQDYIYDRKVGYRKIQYRDIVILLRTIKGSSEIYEKELSNLNIPVFSDNSNSYLETEEIQVILSVLKIIDNPNNDIPLVNSLRSNIFGFTDNELIEIKLSKLNKESKSLYKSIINYIKNENENLSKTIKDKIANFLSILKDLSEKEEYLKLDELIWYIYEITGYYNYISLTLNGEVKTANLKMLFEKAKQYEINSFKGLYNFIQYIEKINKTNKDSTSAKIIGENENVVRIMTIHKSKGLEFPIVFLSETNKKFNMKDLNEKFLLNQDIGFGLKYINTKNKIEYETLSKKAIKIKNKNEMLSEEMRLLYVALTRAKEKLIIVGLENNLKESLNKKKEMIESYKNQIEIKKIEKELEANNNIYGNKISNIIIKNSKSFLDWIENIIINNNNNKENLEKIVNIKEYNKKYINDLIKNTNTNNNINSKQEYKNFKFKKHEIIEKVKTLKENKKIDNILSWNYEFNKSLKVEAKTSVSKLTKQIKDEINLNKNPQFLDKNKLPTKAEIGTAIHSLIQKLKFNEEYNLNKIDKLIKEQIDKKIITIEESKYINSNKILKFTKSDLYKKIKNAKEVFKERSFYTQTKIENEDVLVQGVIDLYFIDKKDDIILVDYKTDKVIKDENELIEKYYKQLEIYKKVLEDAIDKKVNEVYIYSLDLDKEICLKF